VTTDGALAPSPALPRAESDTAAPAVAEAEGTPVPGEATSTSSAPSPASADPIASRHAAETILWVDGITVSFDGFRALDNLSLTLEKGELRCIIGPNGAGKTTLMDVITGKTRPDSGAVKLTADGTDLTSLSEFEIARLGIGRKFQRPTVFQGHTVFENLELACKGPKGVWRSLFGWLGPAERQRIDETLELIGLGAQRDRPAALLAHGHKQWLEIGMLLVQDPQVLLLDEPVAGMTQKETERTAELVQSLAGQRTIVVVEHDMEFVRDIAQKVSVLHEGRLLAEGPMDKVQADPRVIEVYLGS
jgi:urea transport system ATP-binding protein